MELTEAFICPNSGQDAQTAELQQRRKEVPDGECAQKATATPAVLTSPQQLSGNQSNPLTLKRVLLSLYHTIHRALCHTFFLTGTCLIPFARANQLNPWKITIVQKARPWVITDARNAAKCSTHGMCNKKALAFVKNVVPKWE